MSRRDARHDRRPPRRGRWLLALTLVVALVAGSAGAWRYGLLDRWIDPDGDAPSDPVSVAPPAGLELPAVTAPAPVAAVAAPGAISPGVVRRTLAPLLADPDLGPHVLAAVAPLDDADGAGWSRGTGTAVPASTTKVVTATAALLALGPDHVFETRVVSADAGRGVVLVGGGDPFLARGPQDPTVSATTQPPRADLVDLAARTVTSLRRDGVRAVTVGYDAGLFSGPAVDPTWEADYVPDGVVSPTSALWVDEGRSEDGFGRVADPAAEAARVFAAALTAQGIRVRGTPAPAVANGPELAKVAGAPLSEVVERVLEVSDNEAAEVLLRQVGVATDGAGSIRAGRQGVVRLLREEGISLGDGVLHDGSGLSRANRLAPETLVDVLQLASSPERPDLRSVVSGLPVAGFTGSLTDRMTEGPPEGLGRVRAKTGTLTSVSSLAGLATGVDGTPMVFVLMTDRVPLDDLLDGRIDLDTAAAALGACRCGAG